VPDGQIEPSAVVEGNGPVGRLPPASSIQPSSVAPPIALNADGW
jgi:hypothetical protein